MRFSVKQTLSLTYDRLRSLAWSPDGVILAGGGARNLLLWNSISADLVQSISVPEGLASAFSFSADGRRVAAMLQTGAVAIWNVENAQRSAPRGEEIFSGCAAWSPDKKSLAAVAKDNTIGIWESYGGAPEVLLRNQKSAALLAWSFDSQHVAAADSAGAISVWDRHGALVRRFTDHSDPMLALVWSPVTLSLAYSGEDYLVRLRSLKSGGILQVLDEHTESVVGLAFDATGAVLASKSVDGTVKFWRSETGELLGGYQESADADGTVSIAFNPRGGVVASIDSKNNAVIVRSYSDAEGVQSNQVAVEQAAEGPVVFISYSHQDEKHFKRLKDFLKPHERKEAQFWDDTKIAAGQEWNTEIESALKSARIAILLVTQNYLTSTFVETRELPVIVERAKTGSLTILWIAVSASTYAATDLVAHQAVNNPKEPLDTLPLAKRNQAMAEIASRIMAVYRSQRDVH